LGRSERRVAAARYVQGYAARPAQIIVPMSDRWALIPEFAAFVSDSPWEERELWSAIRREVIPI